MALTRAYLAYAGDLSSGVIDPSAVDDEITRKPARPPAAALLAPLATQPVAEALAGLEPADPDYRRLVAEKRRLEAEARTASWGPAVSEGPTLHPEDSGPRVAELRARLARLGYLAPGGETRRRALRPGPRGGGRGVPGATTASSTTGSSARRRSRR